MYNILSGMLKLQAEALKGTDHWRSKPIIALLDEQQQKLNLQILPTTTIGSFPQTVELGRVRREYKLNKYVILDI